MPGVEVELISVQISYIQMVFQNSLRCMKIGIGKRVLVFINFRNKIFPNSKVMVMFFFVLF